MLPGFVVPATARAAEPGIADEIVVARDGGLTRSERARAGVTPSRDLPLAGVEVVATDGDRGDALRALRADPDVEWAEPNHAALDRRRAARIAPVGARQHRASPSGGSAACRTRTSTRPRRGRSAAARASRSASSTPAIDASHPDLAGRVVPGWDFVEGDATPQDLSGHGTHVAGTIAAGQNGAGVIGVAPAARIMPLRVLDAQRPGLLGRRRGRVRLRRRARRAGRQRLARLRLPLAAPSARRSTTTRGRCSSSPRATAAPTGSATTSTPATSEYPCAHEEPNVVCIGATRPERRARLVLQLRRGLRRPLRAGHRDRLLDPGRAREPPRPLLRHGRRVRDHAGDVDGLAARGRRGRDRRGPPAGLGRRRAQGRAARRRRPDPRPRGPRRDRRRLRRDRRARAGRRRARRAPSSARPPARDAPAASADAPPPRCSAAEGPPRICRGLTGCRARPRRSRSAPARDRALACDAAAVGAAAARAPAAGTTRWVVARGCSGSACTGPLAGRRSPRPAGPPAAPSASARAEPRARKRVAGAEYGKLHGMVAELDAARLADALTRLRTALHAVRLPLATPGALAGEGVRAELEGQIGDYLLPRLRQMDAPLLMVVGGSTGAGKSTLVNSLVGEDVSAAGVLRPTTRAPVLACHPDDVRWFADDRILPGLDAHDRRRGRAGRPRARADGAAARRGSRCSTRRTSTRWSRPTARWPASCSRRPTPGSSSPRPRATPTPCRGTCSARRASAAPRCRSCSTACRPRRPDEIAAHLRAMLEERGLGGTPVLVVPETTLEAGRLPAAALAPVRGWLDELAADAQARAGLVRRTLTGALESVPGARRDRPRRAGRAGGGGRVAARRGGARVRRRARRDRRDRPQRRAAARRGARALARRRRHGRHHARARDADRPAARPAPLARDGRARRRGGAAHRGADRRRRGRARRRRPGGRARRPRLAGRRRPGGRCSTAPGGSTPPRPTSPPAPASRCAPGRARCSSSSGPRAPASARPRGSPRSASTAPG